MAYHLKTRIAISVSLLTLTLILLVSWLEHSYFEYAFKATTFQHISDNLEVTAASLSSKAHRSLHALELIRNAIPPEIMDNPAEMQRFLDALYSERIIFDNGIGIFTPDGVLHAITPRQDDIIGTDFSFRNYIKYTLLNKQPYISAPLKARQKHNHPIIMLTEPIFDEKDDVIGILAGSYDLYSSNFLNVLMDYKIGEGGFYMMLDQQETMLVHPDKENILSPASDFFPREQIINFMTNSHGLVPEVNINGKEMIGAFQHISPFNWTLVALIPTEESFQPINNVKGFTFIALSSLFIIIVIFVHSLTNKLTSPLIDLTGKVRQLTQTDNPKFNLKSDQYQELGDLSKSIHSLVTQLAQKRKGLKDQLSFLQILIDTIPGPIFYKDSDFRYLGCNKAFEEYLGVPRDQLVGKNAFDIAPRELAEVYQKADEELWEQGGEQVYETSIKYADGSVRDVIFYKKIFDDTVGNPSGMIGTFLDITDRKKSETALKESEQRFRLLVENAADAFFLHNREGQILDVNNQASESLGYSRKELLAMKVADISMDYDNEDLKNLQKQLSLGRIVTIEDRHRRKDGSALQVEVRLCYTEQKEGLTIALARDITERKYEEAILQNALLDAQTAKSQVDNILSSAADGIVVTDQRNRVTHMNLVAAEILGIKNEEVIGKSFTRLFTNKELREQARAFLKEDHMESHQRDFKLNLSGSNSTRIIEARSANIRTEEGNRTGVVTLLHDVTRERELDQIKNEFISTAAHEMRTPMAVIMGYIELLTDREQFGSFTSEQQIDFLQEAYHKGEALTQIIDDLFDISRIEAGLPLPISKTNCNINQTLQHVIEHFEKHAEKHSFQCDLAEQAILFVDSNKMTQVFENLISNAIKYSPTGGTVKISSRIHDRSLHIDISDTGVGMSEEQLERIFDKFYRVDSSDTAVSGLGLGMYIVKAIVEGHEGSIHVTSTLGQGTRVSITLPLEATQAT